MKRGLLFILVVSLLIWWIGWRITRDSSSKPPPPSIVLTPDVPLAPDDLLITATGLLWKIGGERVNEEGIKFSRYYLTDTRGRYCSLPPLLTKQTIKSAQGAGVYPEPFVFTNVEIVGVAKLIRMRNQEQYMFLRLKSIRKVEGVTVPRPQNPTL